jgi:hypothetical protein
VRLRLVEGGNGCEGRGLHDPLANRSVKNG